MLKRLSCEAMRRRVMRGSGYLVAEVLTGGWTSAAGPSPRLLPALLGVSLGMVDSLRKGKFLCVLSQKTIHFIYAGNIRIRQTK